MLPAVLLIGLPLYGFTGQYKGLTRYAGSRSFYLLVVRNGLLVLALAASEWCCVCQCLHEAADFALFFAVWLTGVLRFALRDFLISQRSANETDVARRHLWRR